MNNLHQKMKEYFLSVEFSEDEYEDFLATSVGIAYVIAFYGHRDQKRDNQAPYYIHPMSCLNLYKRFVDMIDDDPFCINNDLLEKYHLSFKGAQEVALLHDILEDTEVSLDEIEEMFNDFGYATYFELYIKHALILITHDKSESYEIYIDRMLVNPVASICKMMDLTDNMNMLGLASLNDNELDRTIRYAKYFKQINDKWHFIENIMIYKKEK